MNLLFHATWMLCGLGATILAAVAAGRWHSIAALAAGFTTAAVAIRPDRMPDPVWTGTFVAAVAFLQLLRPRFRWVAAACGGALAGLWVSLIQVQGLTLMPALLVAAAVPAVSAWLAFRRPGFAPPALREEALLILCVSALAVAIMPGVSEGWRSAAALNFAEGDGAERMLPAWVIVLTGASALLGGLYRLWVRR